MYRIISDRISGKKNCFHIGIKLTVSLIVFLLQSYLLTLFADSHIDAKYQLNRKQYQVVPEYKRNLKNIVVSLKAGSSSLDLHHEMFKRLPSYTNISLLVSNDVYEDVRESIKRTPYGNKTSVLKYNTEIKSDGTLYILDNAKGFAVKDLQNPVPIQIGTFWMQDIFIPVISPDRAMKMVTPPFHMCLWSKDKFSRDNLIHDNDFIQGLMIKGLKQCEIPVVFNGGNIRFGEISGKRIAFCGSDVLLNTSIFRETFPDEAVSDSIVTDIIAETFGADEVVIIDEGTKQPYYMFHLDQAFVIVADSVACVTRVIENTHEYGKHKAGIEVVENYLKKVRKTLAASGLKIVDIDTPVHNILRQEYYVNAIPFIDAETGEKKILLPVYDTRIKSDKEILENNINKFTSLGYRIIPVTMKENILRGGLHCMINVID
ncbi:MAG: agmatine deiminase family protein [Candidatus Latescibacteria bacterium]|nr:agmatine deiminase family protein [Candidatus Latescibacterota bacterium]